MCVYICAYIYVNIYYMYMCVCYICEYTSYPFVDVICAYIYKYIFYVRVYVIYVNIHHILSSMAAGRFMAVGYILRDSKGNENNALSHDFESFKR